MADVESQARPSATTLGDSQVNLSDDLLEGADEIAEFLYGDRKKRRRVYYLAQKGCLPVFNFGSTLCARRTRLVAHIEEMETKAIKEKG